MEHWYSLRFEELTTSRICFMIFSKIKVVLQVNWCTLYLVRCCRECCQKASSCCQLRTVAVAYCKNNMTNNIYKYEHYIKPGPNYRSLCCCYTEFEAICDHRVTIDYKEQMLLWPLWPLWPTFDLKGSSTKWRCVGDHGCSYGDDSRCTADFHTAARLQCLQYTPDLKAIDIHNTPIGDFQSVVYCSHSYPLVMYIGFFPS